MKAIGLVTFWDCNYGSALQCYSLKQTIQSFGYRCDLVEEAHTGRSQKYIRLLKKCVRIPAKMLLYPKFGKAYLELRKHARMTEDALSSESRRQIHFFGKTVLQPKELTKKELKRIGNSDEYIAFITGSDQVWGGHFVEPTYGNFLEFAPKNKRISYAASFGSDEVANYNRVRYKRGLNGMKLISVREEHGIEIVKKLTGKSAVRMPDPTILLTVEDWIRFSEQASVPGNKKYILVHFLDHMSENAVRTVKLLSVQFGLPVVCLGWKREEVLSLENVSFADGDPRDYISLIRNAAYVCTDSFHTTLFSLRFQKQFFTFPRCYAHRFHQTGRVTGLLCDTGCESRYIKSDVSRYEDLPQGDVDASAFFDEQRTLGLNFLQKALLPAKQQQTVTPDLKPDNECCGCGVCAEKCPKGAIRMAMSEYGYSLPEVDPELCISCGVCETYCKKKILPQPGEKKAYIAYSKDAELLQCSASGGVFSALAKQVILGGGAVFGAAMIRDGCGLRVTHRCAESPDELLPLLQSKYVQSDAVSCFANVRKRLSEGQTVLFSGTSCQVDALYRYLGKRPDGLYTLDLICHGVPGEKFFADYVRYLEEKNHSEIESFSFRAKENGKNECVQKVTYRNGRKVRTQVDRSDYYKLFFSADSYREGCYHCEYASVNKPADLTAGDYFECPRDYPELFANGGELSGVNGLSCCIVHNKNGEDLLSRFGKDLRLIPADLSRVQDSHDNLCFPSIPSDQREQWKQAYKSGGWKAIHRRNVRSDCVEFIPRLCKKAVKKILR